jgi:hypothetical protein
MLKKNNGYIVSEQFRRLQDDIRRYLDAEETSSTQKQTMT